MCLDASDPKIRQSYSERWSNWAFGNEIFLLNKETDVSSKSNYVRNRNTAYFTDICS